MGEGKESSISNKKFPDGFLWGAATSSHQVEGGNHNDWSEWELKNAERLSLEAKSKFGHLSNWKEIEKEATDPKNYISGIACDHYNRYKEDFKLAKELGHNATRFSIEWSRVEPEEGNFNEEAIAHYKDVIKSCHENGLEPFVTLWHWTIPLWLRDKGGILSQEFPEKFAQYTERVVTLFKDDVTYWMTLNEPTSVIANAYFKDDWPPQERSLLKVLRAYKSLSAAHNLAYDVIHKVEPRALVTVGHILKFQEPKTSSFLDRMMTRVARYFTNIYFFKLTKGKYDWLALQYYFHEKIHFNIDKKKTLFAEIANDNKILSDLGWEIYNDGIYHLITWLKSFKKPIFITEHGVADANDTKRETLINEALKKVKRAIDEGADVRGYFHWSLMDNFEWDKGFWPRFGLTEIDRNTLERKPRPSAYVYKKIAENNSL